MAAGLLFCYIKYTNNYPKGSDVYGHLFKANVLYHAIEEGTLYPIYTPYWYNSIELFRYWPAFSYYVVAFFALLTGGNMVEAFLYFGAFCFLLSMGGFLLFGLKEKRLPAAFILGVLYFIFPDNMRVFFSEGNIPRILITAFLPLLFYMVWQVIHYKREKMLIPFTALMCLITFTHIMTSAMVGISLFLFCLIYGIANKEWKPGTLLIVNALISYLVMGILLVPGLIGGLISQSSESSVKTIENWAQEAVVSLNPLVRFENMDLFYFGLSIFIIILLGLIAANKETVAGFLGALLIFFSTTTALTPIIKMLPMKQALWMQRFTPMAMCMFVVALLMWKKLKKSALLIFVLLICIDIIPSFRFVERGNVETAERIENTAAGFLLPEAQEITENRLAIMDSSLWGSLPSYYLSEDMDEGSTNYSFGWAFQGAATIDNIVSVNDALESGFFAYAFDRLLELGNDTVLLSKDMIKKGSLEEADEQAQLRGYTLVKDTDRISMYHIDTEGTFGTRTQYPYLAIGGDAQYICYIYPEFQYATDSVIDHFTVEELTAYQKIYLSGFSYDNKEAAEQLLEATADAGTEIYIDMQHIPEDKLTGKTEFLNVYAQFIQFTERFPIMETDNGSQFKLDFKTPGYDVWNTVYLSGIRNVEKETYYDDKTHLTYLGKNTNDNITFLGFNPIYYYVNTHNANLLQFLNEVFGVEPNKMPEREILPLQVEYDYNEVVIKSEYDDINTNVAALDCFAPDRDLEEESNMLKADKGKTVISIRYPALVPGLVVSVLGVILLTVLWIDTFVLLRRDRKECDANEESNRMGDLS